LNKKNKKEKLTRHLDKKKKGEKS